MNSKLAQTLLIVFSNVQVIVVEELAHRTILLLLESLIPLLFGTLLRRQGCLRGMLNQGLHRALALLIKSEADFMCGLLIHVKFLRLYELPIGEGLRTNVVQEREKAFLQKASLIVILRLNKTFDVHCLSVEDLDEGFDLPIKCVITCDSVSEFVVLGVTLHSFHKFRIDLQNQSVKIVLGHLSVYFRFLDRLFQRFNNLSLRHQ